MKNKPRQRPSSAARKAAGALPRQILRTSREPCRYYSEAQVHRLLARDPAGYLRHVRRALASIARGATELVLPPKQLFEDPFGGGDFRIMPCVVRSGRGALKTVKVIGTNIAQRRVPDQITVGRLLVVDAEENFVSAILEACLLSSARTGACAALAMEALARKREELVVIGCGRVGLYAALYTAVAGARHVMLCDTIHRRSRQAARWLGRRVAGVRFEARAPDCVAAADVVILATTSESAVCSPPAWGANLVISLGADTDAQSELDPAWARHADLYCDTLDGLRFGDLRAWIEDGRVDATAINDLLGVYREPPAASARSRVFVSTGSALFDNLTAGYLLGQGTPDRTRASRLR